MGFLSFDILLILGLLVLPLGYLSLCIAMRRAAVRRAPYIHFFLVFGACGGLLVSVAFAGSPMGVALSVIPIIVAPFVIFISTIILYFRHLESRFHTIAFLSGAAYITFIFLGAAIMSAIG